MSVGVALVLVGLGCVAVAAVWAFGVWGLAGAGLGLIVSGLLPDWERADGVSADKTS